MSDFRPKPQLSDKGLERVGALLVHADQLVEEIFFSGGQATVRMGKLLKQIREDMSDHELMALKLALDRNGLLPKEKP